MANSSLIKKLILTFRKIEIYLLPFKNSLKSLLPNLFPEITWINCQVFAWRKNTILLELILQAGKVPESRILRYFLSAP